MKVYGYSERGLINGIFYSIFFDRRRATLIHSLLSAVKVDDPSFDREPKEVSVYIEQSLSDFGDADVILLAEGKSGRKQIIFIEAKVRTSRPGSAPWKLPADLTRQLCLKVCLMDALRKYKSLAHISTTGIRCANKVCRGKKEIKKTGENPIVNRMCENLKKHLDGGAEIYYLALIPDANPVVLKAFQRSIPAPAEHVGWLFWQDIEKTLAGKMPQVKELFDYNKGQIY